MPIREPIIDELAIVKLRDRAKALRLASEMMKSARNQAEVIQAFLSSQARSPEIEYLMHQINDLHATLSLSKVQSDGANSDRSIN